MARVRRRMRGSTLRDVQGGASFGQTTPTVPPETTEGDGPPEQVGMPYLAELHIGSAQIDDASIGTAEIADLAVTTAKIDNLAVTAAKIGALEVTTAKINDLAVTTAKINDLAVTNAKINDLNASKITAGLLTVDRLNITGIVMTGFVWTDNSPSAGKIEWDAGTLQYDGTTYAISAGNSDTDSYVYWTKGTSNTTFRHSATRPVLGDDDFLIATNTSGIHDLAFNNSGNATSSVFPASLSFESMARLFIYGDGSDGDVTISGDTTLTRDMSYNNLTINSTKVLNPDGYRIYVKGTLTNNGIIRTNGNAGSGINKGTGLTTHNMGGSSDGGQGVVNNNGQPGAALNNGLGATGGAGGNETGTGRVGGAGGVNTVTIANRHGLTLLSNEIEVRGGTGGGGGAASAGNTSGGGGSGGGTIIIAARTISNGSGTIEAKGGNGGNAPGAGPAGGGGGGGGGAVVLVYQTLTEGTVSVAGGTGGTPTGVSGVAGAAGGTGTYLKIQQEA